MKFLFKQVDIASLVFFRIVFGILAFADVTGTLFYKHYYKGSFYPGGFHFKYYGFQWVEPLPEPLMSLFFFSMLIASIFISLGKNYKWSMTYFAFGFTYIFLMEKSYYLNHGYLFCVLSYLMIFFPANRAYSVDVLKKPNSHLKTIPFWSIFLLQFSMGIVYFFGGIAKINPDWLQAMPLKLWLSSKGDYFLIGPLLKQEWLAWFMSYTGLILDLFVVFFLLSKRTRIYALGFVIFFHFVNILIFQIGIFPYLSVSLTLMYFAADFPRKIYRWFRMRFQKMPNLVNWWQKKLEKNKTNHFSESIIYTKFKQNIIRSLIVIFCFVQIAIPLRHHLFKGNVAWTEEGHRYSWRMMLRSKSGYGKFKIKNLKTKKVDKIRPRDMLDTRQAQKLFAHPDMILQFAHHLKEVYKEKGIKDVEIYADIKLKLNGGPYQQYIDPKVDLSKVEFEFFKSADWILPYVKEIK